MWKLSSIEEKTPTPFNHANCCPTRMMNSGRANTPAREWNGSVLQTAGGFHLLLRRVIWLAIVYGMLIVTLTAQEPPLNKADTVTTATPAKEDLSLAPAKVDVNPVASDEEIRQRLQSVVEATDWLHHAGSRGRVGVVFLKGRVASDELKTRAGNTFEQYLARVITIYNSCL